MKLFKTITAFLLFPIFCFANGVPSTGTPSGTNGVEIIWNVPTNHLPSSVLVYKIIPQNFAPVVVSNLMALGSFTMKDRLNIKGQPPFSVYFKNKDGTRQLGVVPTFGFIYYYDSNAQAKGRETPVGVPSEKEVYQLGLEYIQKLGIDRSQLATVGDSTELRAVKNLERGGWFDKKNGTNVEQIYMRGVFFIRRVNGIDFDGIAHGGVHFEFGNHGKISRLEVLWKGLEPYELHSTLNANQLIEELRSGKGKWLPPSPGPMVKKITIYEVEPLYRGIREDDEEHKFLEPYMRLETYVDNGSTNIVADFDCPIIDGAK